MDIHLFALAFVAALYPMVVLVTCQPIASLFGTYGRRTTVIHKSTQPTQSHFALQEGQTLVGVIDMGKVMCFYIGNDAAAEKPYE